MTRARTRKKKRLLCLTGIIAVLALVLGTGSNLVLAYLAEENAVAAVDRAAQLAGDLSTQEHIDAAREAWDKAAELVAGLKEGDARDELSRRLEQIRRRIDDGQKAVNIAQARQAAEAAAAGAVDAAQRALTNLSTQELIDAAFAEFQKASAVVAELHGGPVKEDLLQRLAHLQGLLEKAQELFSAEAGARVATEEAESLLADLSTQKLVDKARAAYDVALELTEALPDSTAKSELLEQLEQILAAIDAAQQELYRKAEAAATEAVEKAEAKLDNLSTQGAVNSANSAYISASTLVNKLHSGEVRDALKKRLSAIKAALNDAQKKLNELWDTVSLDFQGKYYTYDKLGQHLQKLASHYPGLARTAVVGKSVEGNNIWSITIGTGSEHVLILGSVHASEWITTPVLMRTIETLLWDYTQELSVQGELVKDILDRYSITFIPMVNPDGVKLVQEGAGAYPGRAEELLALNKYKDPETGAETDYGNDFSRWKANIRGVDLNRNFPVKDWDKQPGSETVPEPRYAGYPGPYAESEPETKAVVNWVRNNNPVMLLDYHSYGDYLFWWYKQKNLARDRKIVQAMRRYTGYRMEPEHGNTDFSASSTYWGSNEFGIPSVTVELGDQPPRLLGMGHVPGIFARVKYLPLIAIMNLPGY